ncbi:GM21975 [Drosophila sechellia]|uniref:GM21975 n=2 Tax=Drosophila sechellia TaxID=7238 RepID=B4HPQ8_DROSE|nr:GM21975 [Drosophila sechellia]
MSRWSQLKPMEWCKAVYRDCDSWSFVKCSLAFCAGVLLVRSLDGKLPDSS